MKYFAYGSNMNSERMKDRGINFSEREHGILFNWRLSFNKVAYRNNREGYANIEKDEKSIVEGIVYTISNIDIRKLDVFEGYPNHYKRDIVIVRLDDSTEIEAITYIAQPDKVKQNLKPTKKYLSHLLKCCDLLSKPYCEMLKKIETLD